MICTYAKACNLTKQVKYMAQGLYAKAIMICQNMPSA